MIRRKDVEQFVGEGGARFGRVGFNGAGDQAEQPFELLRIGQALDLIPVVRTARSSGSSCRHRAFAHRPRCRPPLSVGFVVVQAEANSVMDVPGPGRGWLSRASVSSPRSGPAWPACGCVGRSRSSCAAGAPLRAVGPAAGGSAAGGTSAATVSSSTGQRVPMTAVAPRRQERGGQRQRLVVVGPGDVRQACVGDHQAARGVWRPVPGLVQDAGQRQPAVLGLQRRGGLGRAVRGQLQQGGARPVPARERAQQGTGRGRPVGFGSGP